MEEPQGMAQKPSLDPMDSAKYTTALAWLQLETPAAKV